MIATIVGSLWVLSGVVFLYRPKRMLRKLQKKGIRNIKRILMAGGIVLSGYMILLGFSYPGVLPKVLLAIGLLGLAKSFFFLKGRAAKRLVDLSLLVPVSASRSSSTLRTTAPCRTCRTTRSSKCCAT